MKLLFSVLLFFLIVGQSLFAQDIKHKYLIKTKGITIGNLTWNLNIAENTYETFIELKNKGFLSKFYSFSGKYSAAGVIKEKIFFPTRYVQRWKTANKNKYVELKFKYGKVESLTLGPEESELSRIQYKELENYKDPLSSFISILFSGLQSYTIDGRRAYLLSPDKKSNKILIKEYVNIWADHKKNDLEYLEIQRGVGNILPEKIIIKFKGSLYYLKKI